MWLKLLTRVILNALYRLRAYPRRLDAADHRQRVIHLRPSGQNEPLANLRKPTIIEAHSRLTLDRAASVALWTDLFQLWLSL